jgi:hypothetical protein
VPLPIRRFVSFSQGLALPFRLTCGIRRHTVT